jgi:hypothetical protein
MSDPETKIKAISREADNRICADCPQRVSACVGYGDRVCFCVGVIFMVWREWAWPLVYPLNVVCVLPFHSMWVSMRACVCVCVDPRW